MNRILLNLTFFNELKLYNVNVIDLVKCSLFKWFLKDEIQCLSLYCS